MTGKIEMSADRIRFEQDGRVSFDTSVVGPRLFRDGTISLSNYTISFPSFWFGIFYVQTQQTVELGGEDFQSYACSSFLGVQEQEWGPDKASPYNLPDIVLGAVPPGTNYLDVSVNLTRTKEMAPVFSNYHPNNFMPQGVDVQLYGGSCLLEYELSFAKMFEVIVVDDNAVLRRRQSVGRNGPAMTVGMSPPTVGSGNRRYFYAGTNAGYNGRAIQWGAYVDDQGPSTGNDRHKPGDSQGCSLTPPDGVDYSSTWTGSLTIVPGCVG